MKKILAIGIIMVGFCCMMACSTKDEIVMAEVTTLRLLPDEDVVFGEAGGSLDIQVETNGKNWNVEASQDWVKIESSAQSFRLIAEENTGTEAMPQAVVTVVASSGEDTDEVSFTVSQEGSAPAVMTIEPEVESLRILYNGIDADFYISSNKVWKAESDQTWCVVTKKDEHTLVISAEENKTFEAMPPATVTIIAGVAPNAVTKKIDVTQEGRPEVIASDLSAGGTSNCYVVSKAGTYMFNACVKGNNATTPGITPTTLAPVSAELLWQDYYSDGRGIANDISYKNGYIYFTTGETFHPGNAVIAAKGANGEILWSWHIWCVADLQAHPYNSYETGTEAFQVLDRNLGAISNEVGSDYALGFYYQWGRKDPFPAAAGNGDGNSRKDGDLAFGCSGPDDYTQPGYTAYTYDSVGTIINSAENMKWSFEIGGKQIEDAVRNPMQFYYQVSYTLTDWLETPNDNLWGNPYANGKIYVFDTYKTTEISTGKGVKTIYDPCPVGYKVAPGNYWSEAAVVYQKAFQSPLMAPNASYYGYVYTAADGAKDWYPLAGRRQNISISPGKLYGVSTTGFMWGSSPAADPAEAADSKKHQATAISVSQTSWNPASAAARSSGMPIRCVRE